MARLGYLLLLAAVASGEVLPAGITVNLVAEAVVDAGAADSAAGGAIRSWNVFAGFHQLLGFLDFIGKVQYYLARMPPQRDGATSHVRATNGRTKQLSPANGGIPSSMPGRP